MYVYDDERSCERIFRIQSVSKLNIAFIISKETYVIVYNAQHTTHKKKYDAP